MVHTHGCDLERESHDNPAMQMYLTGTSPQSFIGMIYLEKKFITYLTQYTGQYHPVNITFDNAR